MTGRGIDQVLPHPSKLELHEDYVRNALEYVEMAEKANGPICDVAVVSLHWGGNWGYAIRREQQSFAHRLIDDGAADLLGRR